MPFIQTGLIHDDNENILHFGAIRIRVVGNGNLDLQLFDLDSVTNQILVPIIMSGMKEDDSDRLSNFITQRAMLRISTDAFDEFMDITRLIFYIKKMWTDYPR